LTHHLLHDISLQSNFTY